jgi:sugar-specific transcriptional regulator TrmB
MDASFDLTPFGFTPTEGLIYEVLLKGGPGTGYTIARTAGIARANVYAALEGLVTKGAARVEEGRPRQFRPEPPTTLLARLSDRQGEAMERLSAALAALTVPSTPTLVELNSQRGAVQLMGHEIARAEHSVALLAPPDGCLTLAPHLRRAAAANVVLDVASTAAVPLGSIEVAVIPAPSWPGDPVLLVVDNRAALNGARNGERFTGHWGSAPSFVASVQRTLTALREGR